MIVWEQVAPRSSNRLVRLAASTMISSGWSQPSSSEVCAANEPAWPARVAVNAGLPRPSAVFRTVYSLGPSSDAWPIGPSAGLLERVRGHKLSRVAHKGVFLPHKCLPKAPVSISPGHPSLEAVPKPLCASSSSCECWPKPRHQPVLKLVLEWPSGRWLFAVRGTLGRASLSCFRVAKRRTAFAFRSPPASGVPRRIGFMREIEWARLFLTGSSGVTSSRSP